MSKIRNKVTRSKLFGTKRKVSSQCICISSIKALAHLVQKIIVQVKVLQNQVKVPKPRSIGQKFWYKTNGLLTRYLCEISASYPHGSKDIAQIEILFI
jgi:hypothetical protein